MTRAELEAAAARAYRRFHWGEDPRRRLVLPVASVRAGDPLVALGTLVELTYRASKDGETYDWEHAFGRRRPLLAHTLNADGSPGRLVVCGGDYTIDARGIVG